MEKVEPEGTTTTQVGCPSGIKDSTVYISATPSSQAELRKPSVMESETYNTNYTK